MCRHEPWMDDRLGSLERGENPTLILRLKSGYAVFGDYQYPPGYCVLLAYPPAGSLNELSLERRALFLRIGRWPATRSARRAARSGSTTR